MKRKCFAFFMAMLCFTAFSQDSAWKLSGNAGTTNAHFLGTTDNRPLFFKVNSSLAGWIDNGNFNNTTFGLQAGRSITTGQRNTALGHSALYTSATGSYNTAIGYATLYGNTTGANNTALGASALKNNTIGVDNAAGGFQSLLSNTTGSYNTAFGVNTLNQNTTGNNNVAIGHRSLFFNTTGVNNTAVGLAAMHRNVSGSYNIAVGYQAMYMNQTGSLLVAIGTSSLYQNTTGEYNIAIGDSALYSNTSGHMNVATGPHVLASNIDGDYNVAAGYDALHNNTAGWGNVALGTSALHNNSTGFWNTAVGTEALYGGNPYTNYVGYQNTAIGFQALAFGGTGRNNVAVGMISGSHALDHLENNTLLGSYSRISMQSDTCINSTALGYYTTITASNQVRVGNSGITSIGGYQDWTNISDSRFKKNVQQDVPGLDFILQLNPVTYHVDVSGLNEWLGVNDPPAFSGGEKTTIPRQDDKAIQQIEEEPRSGFLAQEVEAAAKKINYHFSGVDAPKNDKDLYGLRYAQFVVPLVKAVQEQQKIIEDLKQQNLELQQQLQQIRIKLGMETIITKSKRP